jgi:hypothetical protein
MMEAPMLRTLLVLTLLAAPAMAMPPDWQPVATLDFEPGAATLTEAHRAALDALLQRFPLVAHEFAFEGDHDPSPYRPLRRQASSRLNERLAETRWQQAALHLGVTPQGAVVVTGRPQVRVFVRARAAASTNTTVVQFDDAARHTLEQRIADLQNRLATLDQEHARTARIIAAKVIPDTTFRGIELETAAISIDKRTSDRFYEAVGSFELGLFRRFVRGERQHSGVVFSMSNGSAVYSGLNLALAFESFGIGAERWRLSPVLTWSDPRLRAAIGSDSESATQLWYRADPAVTVGFRAQAQPWDGSNLHLSYLGFGARVHADSRPVRSFDSVEMNFSQRVRGAAGVEMQAVYDERFAHELSYFGGFVSYGLRRGQDRYTFRTGLTRQLLPTDQSDYVNAASFGLRYTH